MKHNSSNNKQPNEKIYTHSTEKIYVPLGFAYMYKIP